MESKPNPYVLDWSSIGQALGADVEASFSQLQQLYDEIDRHASYHHERLQLPCRSGCDACCHQSVFLTPLEFFYAWDQLQREQPVDVLEQVVARGLQLYRRFETAILQLSEPPPEGEHDHYSIARHIAFRCPLLAANGCCTVYSQRELLARAFGCSFTSQGALYGCDLTAKHLANQTVTLLHVQPYLQRLHQLPLTHLRQVYPYYFHLCFADLAPLLCKDESDPIVPRFRLPIVSEQ